jgi:hypothetical protein
LSHNIFKSLTSFGAKKRGSTPDLKNQNIHGPKGLENNRFLDSIKYPFSQKNGWRQERRQP